MAIPAWACVSSFVAESQAASGNGRSIGASARHRSPRLPASSDSACRVDLACQADELDLEEPRHSRCRWPDPATIQSVVDAVGVANHVDFGGQATFAALQRMIYRLF